MTSTHCNKCNKEITDSIAIIMERVVINLSTRKIVDMPDIRQWYLCVDCYNTLIRFVGDAVITKRGEEDERT